MRNNFLHGVLFGLGFSISIVAVVAAAFFWIPWGQGAAMHSDVVMQEVSTSLNSVEGLTVLSHTKVERNGEVAVLGKIKNNGTSAKTSYALEVELFDKDKQFVDLCRESYYSPIKPGDERNFKVTCGGCRAKPLPEHASYQIRVTE